MDSKNIKLVAGGLLGLVAVALLVYFVQSSKDKPANQEVVNQEVVVGDPVDIVLDFYGEWLVAAKSTSTNPYQLELHKRAFFSEALRTRLIDSESREPGVIDPVLCQTVVPENLTGRVVYTLENKAQILIMARDKAIFEQAIVTLNRQNDGWYIDDIECSPGEFAPEREFSFEKEGFLLKNVPPPLNPEYWYVIFEENNEQGHSAPLFFTAETKCVSTEGQETVCNPDQFRDATPVRVFGQMTERGVEVARIEFVE